jgi:tetratricopeptide (TPR) repeat protein
MAAFRSAICSAAFLLILSGRPNPLPAQNLKPPEFTDSADKGFDRAYNLDYEGARIAFQNLRQQYPRHPGPPLYLALTLWQHELFRRQDLRLDRFVSPESFITSTARQMPVEERKAFFTYIAESQAASQAILKEKPGHTDARYFLGSAYGALAAFAVTIDHDRREAVRQGRLAYQLHRQILDEQPDYYDVYVTVGMYEYIVANLPWYVKWIAQFAGYSGTEERSFKYLHMAAAKSDFAAVNARNILVVLCLREKLYDEALEHARFLHQRYPRNFLLHLNVAQILAAMNRPDQAAEEYMKVIEQAELRMPNYQKMPLGALRYNIGKALLVMNRLELAQRLFTAAIQDSSTAERERALSYLCLANLLDLRGDRQQAIATYQQVLIAPNFDDSHSTAQGYLKRPYRRGK